MSPVFVPLGVFILVILLTGLPLVVAWRKRIQWKSTEGALIPIPWLFWELLAYPGVSSGPGKTLLNLLAESAMMGALPLLYVLYRRYVFPGAPGRLQFYGGAAAGLLVAFCLHRFMPTLGMVFE